MLSLPIPPKPAPRLARGPMGLRLCIGPNAFGNALGESLASMSSGGGNEQSPSTPAKSFSDSIDRGPDWLQNWQAQNPRTQDLSEDAWAQIKQEMDDDGQQIVGLSGGAKPARRTPVFDMTNASQSFSEGAAAPAPSLLGTPQRYVVADSSMRMVPNMDYVGPNGEANIVPVSAPTATDSDFFGYTKQTILEQTAAAAVWGVQQHSLLGDAAMYSSSLLGAVTDVLYPGSLQQATGAVAGGVVIGKIAPAAMGYLNSLPYLGDTIPRIAERVFGGEASTVLPHGFANESEFIQFGQGMRTGLSNAGYANAEPILQGSAVTGKSFKTGQPFDLGRVSDFDIGLADSSLLSRANELGIGLRSGGTRTGPLTARDLRALGLRDLSNQMGQQAGRDVNFMIYNNSTTAIQRAPSIILPGKK